MNHQGGSPSISRRGFIGATAAGILGCRHRGTRTATSGPLSRRRPNIVLIVSDDQGFADSGAYGCTDIPTPHIDSLGRDGARFTDGYVSCPVCSPTRAGLMTGRYQARFGWEKNPGRDHVNDPRIGMSVDEITLADILRESGYRTGLVGKWHLGVGPEFHPLARGFDEFYGFLIGANNYLPEDRRAPVYRNETEVDDYEYLTDAFSREAVSFIRRHRGAPFFLYLAYNAVHLPLEATPAYVSRFGHIEDPKRKTYAAMLAAMDDGIGEVRKALRDAGLEDETLIFFHSDNGGPERNASINTPLRGRKGQVYEGGIRVPFFLCWPGVVPAGRTYSEPVVSLDVLPTAAAAAGIPLPEDQVIDGVDLVPFLTGNSDIPPHESLFWRFGSASACRLRDWKLVTGAPKEPELYDLGSDVGEEKDLASERPEIVKQMVSAYRTWESEMMNPPLDQPGAARRQRMQRRAE